MTYLGPFLFPPALGKSPKLPNQQQMCHHRCGYIPAHAEMNVIRPKMQLSGGVAPVSLKERERGKKEMCSLRNVESQLPVYVGSLL